jgi:PAS domain S-box-containing protein
LYRAIFEQSGTHLLLMEVPASGPFLIVDANEASLAAHGYARDEMVGQPITLLDPFTSPEFFAEGVRSLERGQTLVFDVKHRRKDGGCLELEVHSSLVEVAGRRLIVSVERDISAHKEALAALQHQQALMSYVISHARSAIAVHDREMRYIYVSDRYLSEYNITDRDIVGRHHYDVFPDLPQKWRDVHQRALRGEVSSADEDPYFRANGTVEWTRWECRPWYESDGAIGGIIVYTEVITDRKRAQDEKQALQAQLQQAMKMEAIGRLAGGIAHDFNNLLTGIGGNVDLALLDLDPADPLAVTLQEVRRAADSAARLTRQLLAFSRKQIIEPKVLDLNELIARLQQMLARVIGEDVLLSIVPAAGLGPVRIDPGQFEQVLVNLAVNARDAMPDGGQLMIETANVTLDDDYCATHPLAAPGAYVRLAVSDTGVGMDASVKAHLFEPFFTTKPTGRGTGLGLATIFGAVKQAGGSIEVYSEVGRGTTFKLYLPRADAEAVALEAERSPGVLLKGAETVLLVEDETLVRDLALRILRRLGYTVLTASSGEEALEIGRARSERIDLLMTDVVMPGINGRELAGRLAPLHPETKVLFASGYTENIIVHHGVVEENLHFIGKPYTPQGLANKVRAVLGS